MKGLEKHQLVCVDMLDVPRNVRKIYGMALDKNQENLFKKLGFTLEAKTPTEKIYSRFFK